jgi:hypothetical protein
MDTAGINAHICVEKLMEEETLKAKTCIMTIFCTDIIKCSGATKLYWPDSGLVTLFCYGGDEFKGLKYLKGWINISLIIRPVEKQTPICTENLNYCRKNS